MDAKVGREHMGDLFCGDVTVEDRHAGAGVGECHRDSPADPGRPTGHQRASTGQRPQILWRGLGHASTVSAGGTTGDGVGPHTYGVSSGARAPLVRTTGYNGLYRAAGDRLRPNPRPSERRHQ